MADPIGCYVRVTTGEIVDGVYDTVVYVAGDPTPAEAVAAVRASRGRPDEPDEVLSEAVTIGRGPQVDEQDVGCPGDHVTVRGQEAD